MDSIQSFGYNRFRQPHTDIGSYNMGILYPLGFLNCAIGETISNNIDLFARSSSLTDPSFLDCEVSIGHYFVAFEAIDPYYRLRIQQFKGTNQDVNLPTLMVGSATRLAKTQITAIGSLSDHLGLSFLPGESGQDSAASLSLSVYPFWAYHMIRDHFFKNSRLQDIEEYRKLFMKIFPNLSVSSTNADAALASASKLFTLEYVNVEPDRFSTARPEAAGPVVQIPGISADGTIDGSQANIHNLLDAMLIQKVADMIERGGYSYNDYKRILFGQNPDDNSAEYPIFLGGGTAPLQVSTVVNQSSPSDPTASTALGAQAGTVSAYLARNNGFTYTCTRPGIYMPCLWIRPATYYQSGIAPEFRRLQTVASGLIPQLADMQDEPIFSNEVSVSSTSVFDSNYNKSIFGYQDRYQDYRTRTNRIVGQMRTTRQSWYIARPLPENPAAISADFLNLKTMTYSPWVVTDNKEDHFFIRADHDLTRVLPLPQVSKPYVW